MGGLKGIFLLNELPTKAFICSKEYDIRHDYRISVLYEALMGDLDIDDEEKCRLAIALYFVDFPQAFCRLQSPQFKAALEWIAWFYSAGEYDPRRIRRKGAAASPAFSLIHDGGLIYAAFMKDYGIDLHKEGLHWWKFRALLEGLSDECKFKQAMSFRAMDTARMGKEKSEQRAFVRRMKRAYALPDRNKEAEKEAALERLFKGGFTADGCNEDENN
ncbi:MAG: Gp15 family bacteriophage protein [Christensenellales bacterium]|jgi:hypothetical protein